MRKLIEMRELKKKLDSVEDYLDDYLRFEHVEIAQSALYTLHAGGKRLRPAFVLLTAMFFERENEVIPLAAAMELIHMASLIHDDIIDAADTRRGEATINVLSGSRYALHTGDYILTKALQLIDRMTYNEKILSVLAGLSVEMCLGEIEQQISVFDPYQTIEAYNYRIDRKTALLIAICCQVGALAADADDQLVQAFYDFGYNLGMAFQIKDDILDMEQSQDQIGKPAGSDLAHGILTLPTILVLQKEFPEKASLIQLIERRFPGGQSDVERAIALIRHYHGPEEAMIYADGYIERAKGIVEALPEHPVKKLFLAGADFINERAF